MAAAKRQRVSSRGTKKCSVCTRGAMHACVIRVEIQPLGRVALFDRHEWRCNRCLKSTTDDAQAAFNDAARRGAMAAALGHIDGGALRAARRLTGLSQPRFETLLGFGKNTVARWESGQRPLPPYVATIVRLLALHPEAWRDLDLIASLDSIAGGTVSSSSKRVDK